MDEFGHRRSIRREALNLTYADERQRRLEEALSAEPDAVTKSAMAEIAAAHEANAAQHIAEAQFRARQNDLADQAAKEFTEEQQMDVTESVVSPAVEEIPEPESEPKPRRMRRRFVCRNGTWLRIKRLKRLHIGEKVYVRNSAGEFISIGVVNKRGGLPAAYLEN